MVCMTGFFDEKFDLELHFPPLPRPFRFMRSKCCRKINDASRDYSVISRTHNIISRHKNQRVFCCNFRQQYRGVRISVKT